MATASAKKRLIARLILLALLFAVVWFVKNRQAAAPQLPAPNTNSGQQTPQTQSGVPKYALDVLDCIRRNGQAPAGYVGGREFQNREKKLPAKSGDGKRIRYSEWDVLPKEEGKNRGPERLVTGSDHSAWYTNDHYKSFLKIER
jgi:guanyl-specific ribonuclease Sa